MIIIKWLDGLKVAYSIQSGQICKRISAGFIRKSLSCYLQTSSVMEGSTYFPLQGRLFACILY